MSKVWFCSDTHLGHINILKYESIRRKSVWEAYYKNRMTYEYFEKMLFNYFETNNQSALRFIINQHDELIIKNWNARVSKDDLVWFLGDFCMGSRDAVIEYKSRLNGNIRMIKGNHDNYHDAAYLTAGFKSVYNHPVVLKSKFILSHAPIDLIARKRGKSDFINIFGHVHSSKKYRNITKKYTCVCIERNSLLPIQLEAFDNYKEPEFTEYTTKS